MTTSRKRVIAYIRVSTEEQGRSDFGLQAQEAQIRGFAEAAGFNVVRVFRDVGSGVGPNSAAKRSGLQEAFQLARSKRWPVLVASLDRLSRNTAELESVLERKGLKVISARNGINADALILHGEAVRAEKEAALISERTKRALREKKAEGVVLGNPNLPEAQKKGAETNKRCASQRASELKPVIHDIRTSGMVSAHEIADALNARGYRTSRGLSWNKGNVRRLLERVDEVKPTKPAPTAEQLANPIWGTM